MASPPPEIAVPVGEEDREVEEGDAFDIPSKNASYDRLRRWRVCHLRWFLTVASDSIFCWGLIIFWDEIGVH
jgi:hypothetical protein